MAAGSAIGLIFKYIGAASSISDAQNKKNKSVQSGGAGSGQTASAIIGGQQYTPVQGQQPRQQQVTENVAPVESGPTDAIPEGAMPPQKKRATGLGGAIGSIFGTILK